MSIQNINVFADLASETLNHIAKTDEPGNPHWELGPTILRIGGAFFQLGGRLGYCLRNDTPLLERLLPLRVGVTNDWAMPR